MAPRPDNPLEDREYPDESDLDNDNDLLVPCPVCNHPILEDTPQCPHCRQWLSPASSDWRSSRKWYLRGGLWFARSFIQTWLVWTLLSLLALLLWLANGGLH